MEFQFLFSAYCLMMVYMSTKFHENILNGISELWSGHEMVKDGQTEGGQDII